MGLGSQTVSEPADYQYLSHKLSPESLEAEAMKVHQSLIKKNNVQKMWKIVLTERDLMNGVFHRVSARQ